MRIGIITFHNSYNCGSILQCLALKEILERENENVDIIHFSSLGQQKLYSVFYRKKTVKNVVKNILCIPGYGMIKKHYEQYHQYISKAFQCDRKPYQSSEELRNNLPAFDMVIAGGDQIWNVNCEDFASAYFIDFMEDTYKIAYAPSLGATDINQSESAALYRKLLLQFQGLSIREKNGAKWLNTLLGTAPELVADPTLLLDRESWMEKLNGKISLPFEGDYIFYYAFAYSAKNNQVVQQIAGQTNCKVVVIDAKQWYIKQLYRYKNFVLLDQSGPDAFLALMKGAKYVFTTSFHGTVFSLLFEKQFLYIQSHNHNPADDRTSGLMERMHVSQRMLPPEMVSLSTLEKSINYDAVNAAIDDFRKQSMEYLRYHLRLASIRGK